MVNVLSLFAETEVERTVEIVRDHTEIAISPKLGLQPGHRRSSEIQAEISIRPPMPGLVQPRSSDTLASADTDRCCVPVPTEYDSYTSTVGQYRTYPTEYHLRKGQLGILLLLLLVSSKRNTRSSGSYLRVEDAATARDDGSRALGDRQGAKRCCRPG